MMAFLASFSLSESIFGNWKSRSTLGVTDDSSNLVKSAARLVHRDVPGAAPVTALSIRVECMTATSTCTHGQPDITAGPANPVARAGVRTRNCH